MEARTRNHLLLSLLLFSAAVRMFFFFQLRGTDLATVPLLDSETYYDWAVRLVAGDWGWSETYWMGPLYPHFLALVYLVFGVGGSEPLIIQLGMSLLNVWLVYRFARNLLPDDNGGTALLGTALFAFYGAPVFYAGNLLMATLVTTLFLLTGLLTIRAIDKPILGNWFILGVMTGLTGLARGNVLLLLAGLPLLLWIVPAPPAVRWKNLAGLLLGGVLMLAPVTLRNLIVADDFVLLTSNGGVNLLIGQQHDYKGIFAPVMEEAQAEFDPSMETTLERELGRDLKGSEVSRILTRRAWIKFRDNPGAMPLHYARKAYRFWNGYELPQIVSYDYWKAQFSALWVLPVPFVLLSALGLLGFRFLPRSARWIMVMALLPRWAALEPAEIHWQVHLHEASRAGKRGDLPRTLAKGRQAEEVRPGLADTPFHLSLYLEDLGAHEEALDALGLAQVRYPGSRLIPYRMGRNFEQMKKYNEALDAYERASFLDPDWAYPFLRGGLVMNLQGRKGRALDLMEKAYERSPGNFRVRSNLAALYAEGGQIGLAVEILTDLTRDYPLYVNGWFNLALAHYRAGNPHAAAAALDRAAALRGLTDDQREQVARLQQIIEKNPG